MENNNDPKVVTFENQFDKIHFEKWEKIKYFSMKNRNKYPNLFFYYFNFNGYITKEFSKSEKMKIISLITNGGKKYNGLWGFISLEFSEKNGLEIYKFVTKNKIFSTSISIPCLQEGKPYDDKIKGRLEEILKKNENLYIELEKNFEEYLDQNIDKKNEFQYFIETEKILFHCHYANLKNFLNIKYTENEINHNFYKNLNVNYIDENKKTLQNIRKQEKSKTKVIEDIDEIEENSRDEVFFKENREITESSDISSFIMENSPHENFSDDSSFRVICNKKNYKEKKYQNNINDKFSIMSTKNIDNISNNFDSITGKETISDTPCKNSNMVFNTDIKFKVFEENENGCFSDNFKNLYLSENESIFSDDEKNKKKFGKYNLDFNTNNHHGKNYKENEKFNQILKKKKLIIVKSEENLKKERYLSNIKINKKNNNTIHNSDKKTNLTDKLELENSTQLSAFQNEQNFNETIKKKQFINDNDRMINIKKFDKINNDICQSEKKTKTQKSKFEITKRKENQILIKNYSIDFDFLKKFDDLHTNKTKLKIFDFKYKIKDKLKKKIKLRTKYPEFEKLIRDLYIKKKKIRKLEKEDLKLKNFKQSKILNCFTSIQVGEIEYQSSINLANRNSGLKNPLSSLLNLEKIAIKQDISNDKKFSNILEFSPQREKKSYNRGKEIFCQEESEGNPSSSPQDSSTNFLRKKKEKKSKGLKNHQEKPFINPKNGNLNCINLRNYLFSQSQKDFLFEDDDLSYLSNTNPNLESTFNKEKSGWKKIFRVKDFKHNLISHKSSDSNSIASYNKMQNVNRKNKNEGKKNKDRILLNVNHDIIQKNHNILDFFQASNLNKDKEDEIIKNFMKLFSNEKYSKLLDLIENNIDQVMNFSNLIYQYSEKITNEFNYIKEEILNIFRPNNLYLSDFLFFLSNTKTLDFENDYENSFKCLFLFYKENLFSFLNAFYYDGDEELSDEKEKFEHLNDNKLKDWINNLVLAENTIKSILKNLELIMNLDNVNDPTKTYQILTRINFFPLILSEIKEIYIFFLKKILLENHILREKFQNLNSINENDENIFSEFLINRLGVYIILMENLILKQANILEQINNYFKDTSFNNFHQKISSNLNTITKTFTQFLQIIFIFILIKIYSFDFSELNIKKFEKEKINQNFQFMSLLKILVETYSKIDIKKHKKIEGENIETIFYLIKIIINEYLIEGCQNMPHASFDFETICNKNIVDNNINMNITNLKNIQMREKLNPKKASNSEINQSSNQSSFFKKLKSSYAYLIESLILENIVNKDLLLKNFKICIYKIFIIFTNKVQNISLISFEIKKLLHYEQNLHLFHRYFNIIGLAFFDVSHKYSKLAFFEEVLEKNISIPIDSKSEETIVKKTIFSYFDLENIIKQTSNELRNRINLLKKCNLLNEFLISDLKTLIIYDKFWKIEQKAILKSIFLLFSVLNSKHRRHIESETLSNSRSVYKLIDSIFGKVGENFENDENSCLFSENKFDEDEDELNFFNFPENFSHHLEFIFKITRFLRKILYFCKEEKNKKMLLSTFVSQYNMFLNKDKYYCQNVVEFPTAKFATIPILTIVLCYIEFMFSLRSLEEVDKCVSKIKQIMDFDKSSVYFKGINIAITIKILLSFTNKNYDLGTLINNFNEQIRYLYEQINIHLNNVNSVMSDGINKPTNSNFEENFLSCQKNKNFNFIQNEIYPTLHFLLNNLQNISKERTKIFIDNPIILIEMKNLLNPKLKIALNYKQIIINILANCLEKCESIILNKYREDSKIEENYDKITILDANNNLLEISSELFKDYGYIREILYKEKFINAIKDDFIPILKELIYISISENKAFNGSINNTISFPFLKSISDLFTKICGTLCKYKLLKVSEFADKFGIDSAFFSSAFRKRFAHNCKFNDFININNGELLDAITQITFGSYGKFLEIYKNFFEEEILNGKDFKILMTFLKIFFYAILYNNSYQNYKNTYSIFNRKLAENGKLNHNLISIEKKETENYIFNFLSDIRKNVNRIYAKIHEIYKEIDMKKHKNEDLKREEISILNLILFFVQEKNFAILSEIFIDSTNSIRILSSLFQEKIRYKKDGDDNKIDFNILVILLRNLDEIFSRGIALEYLRKSRNILQNSFKEENYSFNILNFCFDILLRIIIQHETQNSLDFKFVEVWHNLTTNLLNHEIKDLASYKLCIGKNLFEYCSYILNKVFTDNFFVTEKGIVRNLSILDDPKLNNKLILNYLVERIKGFLEFYQTYEMDKFETRLKNKRLNISEGFIGDSYYDMEKEMNRRKKEVYKKEIYIDYEYLFNNSSKEENIYSDKEENFELFELTCKMDIDENSNFNKNSKEKEEQEIDDEIIRMIIEEEEKELLENLKDNNSDQNFQKFSYANNTSKNQDTSSQIKFKIVHENNKFNEIKFNTQKICQTLNDPIFFDLVDNNKSDINNEKFRNIIIEMNTKKKKYIKNLINILRYVSSDYYSQENLLRSQNYYLYVLFLINKITNFFPTEKIFFENLENVFCCINFKKYRICRIEDFYYNAFIINQLDYSISLSNSKLSKIVKVKNNKKFSYHKLSQRFIFRLFVYLVINLNFLLKYLINLINVGNKFYQKIKFTENHLKISCIEFEIHIVFDFDFKKTSDENNKNKIEIKFEEKKNGILFQVFEDIKNINSNLKKILIYNHCNYDYDFMKFITLIEYCTDLLTKFVKEEYKKENENIYTTDFIEDEFRFKNSIKNFKDYLL